MKKIKAWNHSFQQERLCYFCVFLPNKTKTLGRISEHFHNPNSKRKLFKVTRVLVLTAMETQRSISLNQLLRMNLYWFIIFSPRCAQKARAIHALLMHFQKKPCIGNSILFLQFKGGRLRVLCQGCNLGSWVTKKIQRNTSFCALNKKSFVTEYKYGEVISNFIITTLFIMTNFETD